MEFIHSFTLLFNHLFFCISDLFIIHQFIISCFLQIRLQLKCCMFYLTLFHISIAFLITDRICSVRYFEEENIAQK